VSHNTCFLGDDKQTIWVDTKGQVIAIPTPKAFTYSKILDQPD